MPGFRRNKLPQDVSRVKAKELQWRIKKRGGDSCLSVKFRNQMLRNVPNFPDIPHKLKRITFFRLNKLSRIPRLLKVDRRIFSDVTRSSSV